MSVCLYLYLPACQLASLPANQSACLSVCLSVRPSVRPSVRRSVWVPECLSVCVSVCLCLCISMCLPVCLPACPYVWLYVRMSVCPYVCLSVCLSGRGCLSFFLATRAACFSLSLFLLISLSLCRGTWTCDLKWWSKYSTTVLLQLAWLEKDF